MKLSFKDDKRAQMYGDYPDSGYDADEGEYNPLEGVQGEALDEETYHGTVVEREDGTFSAFDTSSSDYPCFWVTPDERAAEAFTQWHHTVGESVPVVLRVRIHLRNALHIDQTLASEMMEYFGCSDPRDCIPYLERLGFDGWVTSGSYSRVGTYTDIAVFDNGQYAIEAGRALINGAWTPWMPLSDLDEYIMPQDEEQDTEPIMPEVKQAATQPSDAYATDKRLYDAMDPEARANLDAFMQGSVVKWGDGTPMRVFHFTNKDFTKFDPDRRWARTRADAYYVPKGFVDYGNYDEWFNVLAMLGTHFSEAAYANSWAASADNMGQGDGSRVIPCYLSIKRPFGKVGETTERDVLQALQQMPGINEAFPRVGPFLSDFTMKYDGLVYIGTTGDPETMGLLKSQCFSVFRPNQIKSATGNTGAFDPKQTSHIAATNPWKDGQARPGQAVVIKVKGFDRGVIREIKDGGMLLVVECYPKKSGEKILATFTWNEVEPAGEGWKPEKRKKKKKDTEKTAALLAQALTLTRGIEKEASFFATAAWSTAYDTPEIRALREETAKRVQERNNLGPDLSPQHQKARQRIIAALSTPVPNAQRGHQAWILLGPPGAGKSTLAEQLGREYGATRIEPDMAKEMHPAYDAGRGTGVVHQESLNLTRLAIERFGQTGYNVILETTGWDESTIWDMKDWLGPNYEYHIILVNVPTDVAVRRTLDRWKQTGRFVDPAYTVNRVGQEPARVYNTLKRMGNEASYSHYDADVPQGEPYRHVEGKDWQADAAVPTMKLAQAEDGSPIDDILERIGLPRRGEPVEEPCYPQAQPEEESGPVLSWKPDSQVRVTMTPDEFLREVGSTDFGPDATYGHFWPEGYRKVFDKMQTGHPLDTPFFDYDVETGEVTGHEGRHRAYAAKQLGIPRIPVVIFLRKGGGYVPVASVPEVVQELEQQFPPSGGMKLAQTEPEMPLSTEVEALTPAQEARYQEVVREAKQQLTQWHMSHPWAEMHRRLEGATEQTVVLKINMMLDKAAQKVGNAFLTRPDIADRFRGDLTDYWYSLHTRKENPAQLPLFVAHAPEALLTATPFEEQRPHRGEGRWRPAKQYTVAGIEALGWFRTLDAGEVFPGILAHAKVQRYPHPEQAEDAWKALHGRATGEDAYVDDAVEVWDEGNYAAGCLEKALAAATERHERSTVMDAYRKGAKAGDIVEEGRHGTLRFYVYLGEEAGQPIGLRLFDLPKAHPVFDGEAPRFAALYNAYAEATQGHAEGVRERLSVRGPDDLKGLSHLAPAYLAVLTEEPARVFENPFTQGVAKTAVAYEYGASWLAPDGKILPLPPGVTHNQMASQLASKAVPPRTAPLPPHEPDIQEMKAADWCFASGYIRAGFHPQSVLLVAERRPTPEQMQAIEQQVDRYPNAPFIGSAGWNATTEEYEVWRKQAAALPPPLRKAAQVDSAAEPEVDMAGLPVVNPQAHDGPMVGKWAVDARGRVYVLAVPLEDFDVFLPEHSEWLGPGYQNYYLTGNVELDTSHLRDNTPHFVLTRNVDAEPEERDRLVPPSLCQRILRIFKVDKYPTRIQDWRFFRPFDYPANRKQFQSADPTTHDALWRQMRGRLSAYDIPRYEEERAQGYNVQNFSVPKKAPIHTDLDLQGAQYPADLGPHYWGKTAGADPYTRFSIEEAQTIGNRLGVDWTHVHPDQFAMGLGVELEHSDVTGGDIGETARIALDHLKEMPDYYTKLRTMEKSAQMRWFKAPHPVAPKVVMDALYNSPHSTPDDDAHPWDGGGGWLLPDGRIVQGDHQPSSLDALQRTGHVPVYPTRYSDPEDAGWDSQSDVRDMGAIRWSLFDGEFCLEIGAPPTPAQMRFIRTWTKWSREFYYDLYRDGNLVSSGNSPQELRAALSLYKSAQADNGQAKSYPRTLDGFEQYMVDRHPQADPKAPELHGWISPRGYLLGGFRAKSAYKDHAVGGEEAAQFFGMNSAEHNAERRRIMYEVVGLSRIGWVRVRVTPGANDISISSQFTPTPAQQRVINAIVNSHRDLKLHYEVYGIEDEPFTPLDGTSNLRDILSLQHVDNRDVSEYGIGRWDDANRRFNYDPKDDPRQLPIYNQVQKTAQAQAAVARIKTEMVDYYKGEAQYNTVARDKDGNPLGLVEWTDGGQKGQVYIKDVLVHRNHRREGIASAMYDHIRAENPEAKLQTFGTVRTDEGAAFREAYDRRRGLGKRAQDERPLTAPFSPEPYGLDHPLAAWRNLREHPLHPGRMYLLQTPDGAVQHGVYEKDHGRAHWFYTGDTAAQALQRFHALSYGDRARIPVSDKTWKVLDTGSHALAAWRYQTGGLRGDVDEAERLAPYYKTLTPGDLLRADAVAPRTNAPQPVIGLYLGRHDGYPVLLALMDDTGQRFRSKQDVVDYVCDTHGDAYGHGSLGWLFDPDNTMETVWRDFYKAKDAQVMRLVDAPKEVYGNALAH